MTRGLARGSLIGAVIGAVLLTPLASFEIADLAFAAKLALVMVIGAVAGAVVGGVFFAGATAEVVDDDSDGDPSVVPDRLIEP